MVVLKPHRSEPTSDRTVHQPSTGSSCTNSPQSSITQQLDSNTLLLGQGYTPAVPRTAAPALSKTRSLALTPAAALARSQATAANSFPTAARTGSAAAGQSCVPAASQAALEERFPLGSAERRRENEAAGQQPRRSKRFRSLSLVHCLGFQSATTSLPELVPAPARSR